MPWASARLRRSRLALGEQLQEEMTCAGPSKQHCIVCGSRAVGVARAFVGQAAYHVEGLVEVLVRHQRHQCYLSVTCEHHE